MFRRLAIVGILLLALSGRAFAAEKSTTVKIMTQNMDAGTDQTYIVAAMSGYLPLADAVDMTYIELQAGNLPGRAGRLADQIAGAKPEIVALQECTLWRVGSSPESATTTLFDQLAELQQALALRLAPYDVVAINTVSDLALPGRAVGALRMIDRNVLLVRADLRPPELSFSEVHSHMFQAALPFGPLRIPAGWISAKVHAGNQHFQLIATHLESTVPGVPEATAVQVAQADELLRELRNVVGPVILCGDFNSDANHNPAIVDYTPTAGLIQSAGYQEAWSALHPGDPGDTWPLYREDLFPPDFGTFPPASPVERIDLFFSQGVQVLGVERVMMPPYASDHAGVIAKFQM